MTQSLLRRFAAEAMGSGFLFAGVIGSGIMAERLAGGDIAVALIANTLATGAILFALIAVLAPLSGAHFNPAVSLVMALRHDLSPRDLVAYLTAQFIGGIVGVVAAHAMFDVPLWQVSTHVRTGPGQWLAEGVATFGLLVAVLGTKDRRPAEAGAIVALYIVAAYWFTASTSFANPAITVARSMTDSFAGIAPANAPAFILAQLAGAFLAMIVGGWLFASNEPSAP